MNRLKRNALYEWYAERRYALVGNANERRIPFIDSVLPKNGIGAELGVFKGNFSPVLLRHTNATKLHLIDPWYFAGAQWHWARGNQSTIDALTGVLRRFRKEIESGRVLVHVGDDRQVLGTFPDGYFDWVYLDTTHTYEHTRDELPLLAAKVNDNGVIAGDDWYPDPDHMHHGVYRAVNEFIGSGSGYRLTYAEKHDAQWAIRRK